MDFLLSDIHTDLAAGIDALLTKADSPAVARAWAAGDRAPATAVFDGLAQMGVFGLLITEDHDGAGAGALEMVVAAEQLGRHAVPGPLAETLAAVPRALAAAGRTEELRAIAAGRLATIAAPPIAPLAADADAAELRYVLDEGALSTATATEVRSSVDTCRTVATLRGDEVLGTDIDATDIVELGALATAAQLVGIGDRILALSSEYALARKQFGRQIGSFQAVKHHLADVAIALEMARPLVYGAAVGFDGDGDVTADADPGAYRAGVSRDISAAKVAAADAAYLASRKGLQILGAIGYTAEHDLSIYLTKCRALVGAWGSPALHRARILTSLANLAEHP